MAQVTGGSDVDEVWEEWANVSLLLLREAAATFAKSGGISIQPSIVTAVLLGVLAKARPSSLYIRPQWPARFFDGTQQPPATRDSLARLGAPSVTRDLEELEATLTGVIATAASEWAQGDPERPETAVVLRSVFEILWNRRLIPRPPSKQYPHGV